MPKQTLEARLIDLEHRVEALERAERAPTGWNGKSIKAHVETAGDVSELSAELNELRADLHSLRAEVRGLL